MVFEPPNPADALGALAGSAAPTPAGFATSQAQTSGGYTTESQLPNGRPSITTRNIMHWLVPEGPIVQMYINPQNVTYQYRKAISPQRTKGGFVIQYWGEEITTLRLTGTTGSSGIEGINVLEAIYRNEQIVLDPYALFLAAANDASTPASIGGAIGAALGGTGGASIGGTLGGLLGGSSTGANVATQPRPTLASLAFTVELYWSGEVYHGYFTDFTVTESAQDLGMFNYDLTFMVTQKRGFRANFLPHHRSPNNGPSNSDPYFGVPYSYGLLLPGDQPTPQLDSTGGVDLLQSITDSFGGF